MPSKLSFEINLDDGSAMSGLTMKAYNMVKKSRKNEKKTETKEQTSYTEDVHQSHCRTGVRGKRCRSPL